MAVRRELTAIAALGRGGMNFDLGRMAAVNAVLGHPERRFAAVHVAGTNGKGSVCSLLAATFRACGYRTGLYTSPHLERLSERFRLDGREISEAELSRLSRHVRQSTRRLGFELTQFEFLTAIAFVYFAEQKVDIAVVEVGLGGRLDATNTLGHVAASVITNIGLDHMDWLGDTEAKIAGEKAGIVRPRVPVVTGAEGAALAVIAARARDQGAPLTIVADAGPAVPATRFAGPHQRRNAAVAYAAVERLRRLGFSLPEPRIRNAFRSARWPGRFERFTLKAGQNRITWILDGAHNVPAARALAETLKERQMRRVELVFGALRDKDFQGVARIVAPFAERVTTTTVPSGRAADARTLAALACWRGRADAVADVEAALESVRRRPPRLPVLITGSLYLVGAARAWLSRQRAL